MPGVCWHDCTEHPRPSLRMQGKAQQRVHRVWRGWKGPGVPQEKIVQVTRTKGCIRATQVRCKVIMLSRILLYAFLIPAYSVQWMIICFVSGSLLNSFLSEPSLNQMNCLILFVSCISFNVVELTSCSHWPFYLMFYFVLHFYFI